MKRVTKASLLCLLLFTLSLTGCANGGASISTEKKAETKGQGEAQDKTDNHVLTIAQSSDLTTMDPQNALSTTSDNIFHNMYSRLFIRDDKMEIKPDLVESYQLINDTTWHFTLKKGVTFHNGDPLTSQDVKYTLERVVTDKKLKEAAYFKEIAEVKVIDDLNFEIITKNPLPTMLNLLAKSGADIMPHKYIQEIGWDQFLRNPIGSGPYQFVEWKRDDRVVLKPYDNYYGGKVTQWEQVIYRSIPESSTRVGELLTGGIDLATDIPPNEWERVNNSPDTKLLKGETTRVMLMIARTTSGTVTADPRVREAIDLAIDKNALATNLLQGAGVPIRTRVTTGVVGSNPALNNTSLYDPEKAKQLLAEAGYPNGLQLTLTAPKGRYLMDAEVAEMVSGMLAEVGIKVNLELLESSKFVEVYDSKQNKELILIGLADGLLDASYSLVHYTKSSNGVTTFDNEEVEKLYTDAVKNMNKEERIKQLQRIQEIVAEERPHIFLYQTKASYGARKTLEFQPRLDEGIYLPNIK